MVHGDMWKWVLELLNIISEISGTPLGCDGVINLNGRTEYIGG